MITLNLIPQEQKTILKNNRLFIALKEAATLMLLFGAIISVMLWASRYYLEQQLADLIIQNAANIQTNELTNQKIKMANSKLTAINDLQKSFYPNRQILIAFTKLLPPNISCSQIKFYRQQSLLEITGLAQNRDSLLQFKTKLEQIPWIKKVDLPMTALIDKENNNFILRLEINTAELPLL
jgi:Tfp pilus assembly protein PilN